MLDIAVQEEAQAQPLARPAPAAPAAATSSRKACFGQEVAAAGRAGAAPPGVLKVDAEFLCL